MAKHFVLCAYFVSLIETSAHKWGVWPYLRHVDLPTIDLM